MSKRDESYNPLGEKYLVEAVAPRKGKGKKGSSNLCEIKIGITIDGEVVLRTVDESGIAPLVAVLDVQTARELEAGLRASIEALH